jgi:hypothetical protein
MKKILILTFVIISLLTPSVLSTQTIRNDSEESLNNFVNKIYIIAILQGPGSVNITEDHFSVNCWFLFGFETTISIQLRHIHLGIDMEYHIGGLYWGRGSNNLNFYGYYNDYFLVGMIVSRL